MRTELEVVNTCLATVGQRPLNSIIEPNAFKAAARNYFSLNHRDCQAPGRWFNRENLRLEPSPYDGSLVLPGDTLEIRTGQGRYVARGNRVFNLDDGTFVFEDGLDIELIRLIEYDLLPHTAQVYIAAKTVYDFQMSFDADSARVVDLAKAVARAWYDFHTQDIRATSANLVRSNVRLQQLKHVTRGARRLLTN